ncbi:type II toxin-antitoxin system Phd/YefM family antitoxin [Pseudoduganella violacea]|uniref:Antitoxin n=1 Tax=Pseudoduganella violacea TaxID=1715466 RepID=A0A7W5BEU7_9BURK|nr:type II toxin-antitoxin system Phd/YefM family antitoxin [Pseudoduganella violacea]MBB3121828.1 prevent-host-death family protein [Pseudoduganella violacea]
MKSWADQDAKARFNEFLEACLIEGPQMVTQRGSEAAVLVPAAEWRRLQPAVQLPLKEMLLSDKARTDDLTPQRGKAQRRPIRNM